MIRRLLSALILIPAIAYSSVLNDGRDWSFIQSVGGIEVKNPEIVNGRRILPVNCDVSGLHAFTIKPTSLNSALTVTETKASVVKDKIYVTVVTGLGGKSSRCSGIDLGDINPGGYEVLYRGANGSVNKIGEVKIGL